MELKDLLAYHGIEANPFSEEDAQTDQVFKQHCIDSTYHPTWDKVFGHPSDPATSIVFGEKGSGKTALRLQAAKQIDEYNKTHPNARCFVISYDDFNPFLDNFRERWKHKRTDKVLREFQLWDHIDAILSLGVTKLLDGLFRSHSLQSGGEQDAMPGDFRKRLTSHQRRDLLLLAACYDNSKSAPFAARWHRLFFRLFGASPSSWGKFLLGSVVSGIVVAVSVYAIRTKNVNWSPTYSWILATIVIAGWLPWIIRTTKRWWLAVGIARHVRVFGRPIWTLSRLLAKLTNNEIASQPFPNKDRTDDRYRLLGKFQAIMQALGFAGITVLVDRVDEPHLINGSPTAMRDFLWPLLDSKFLQQPGIGIKLMLPAELHAFVDKEDRDFYQRARLDKQNMIPSLGWTGQALYDLANARISACSKREPAVKLADLIDDTVSTNRLFDALQSLRVPRNVFKFLFRAITVHCNKYPDDQPVYRISSETFESQLALYRREQEAADQGLATV